MQDIVTHKPEPYPWQETDMIDEWGEPIRARLLRCRICDKQIQRRGIFRRWRHVS